MKYRDINEAAHAWVNDFSFIPEAVIEKLMNNGDYVEELTAPATGDSVFVFDEQDNGEIIRHNDDGSYVIHLYVKDEDVVCSINEIDVEYDGCLPMWGTMFAVDNICDDEWIRDHLQEVSDCGFRIYEQEDFGILLGIDGAGYDFYEAHWIPLYKARGLHWHEND